MKVRTVITGTEQNRGKLLSPRDFARLKTCTEFFAEMGSFPLYKALYRDENFIKFKIRTRNFSDPYCELFNETFQIANLRQRSFLCQTAKPSAIEGTEYVVFIPNGYKYLYNPVVVNSFEHYSSMFNHLEISDIKELLVDGYYSSGVTKTTSASEVIIYNIPFVYMVKSSLFNTISYEEFLQGLFS